MNKLHQQLVDFSRFFRVREVASIFDEMHRVHLSDFSRFRGENFLESVIATSPDQHARNLHEKNTENSLQVHTATRKLVNKNMYSTHSAYFFVG